MSRHIDLSYVSIDREFFCLPGWVRRDKAEERRLIAQTVAAQRWLMDGSGPSTFDLRLPRAELVIWLRLPRWRCLLGVVKRGIRHFGRTRPDMAPGCNERFPDRSEEQTTELQSLMRISYAVFCLNKKIQE